VATLANEPVPHIGASSTVTSANSPLRRHTPPLAMPLTAAMTVHRMPVHGVRGGRGPGSIAHNKSGGHHFIAANSSPIIFHPLLLQTNCTPSRSGPQACPLNRCLFAMHVVRFTNKMISQHDQCSHPHLVGHSFGYEMAMMTW
jgi:hypothetical protein